MYRYEKIFLNASPARSAPGALTFLRSEQVTTSKSRQDQITLNQILKILIRLGQVISWKVSSYNKLHPKGQARSDNVNYRSFSFLIS